MNQVAPILNLSFLAIGVFMALLVLVALAIFFVVVLIIKRTRILGVVILGILAAGIGFTLVGFLLSRGNHGVVSTRNVPTVRYRSPAQVEINYATGAGPRADEMRPTAEAMRRQLEVLRRTSDAERRPFDEIVPDGMPYDIVFSSDNEDSDEQQEDADDANDDVAPADDSSDEQADDEGSDNEETGDGNEGVAVAEDSSTDDNLADEDGTANEVSTSRPDWIKLPPKRVGDTYRLVVVSDPFLTKREGDEQIDDLISIATAEYLEELLGPSGFALRSNLSTSDKIQWVRGRLARLRITTPFIRENICIDEFVENVETSLGPMKRVHVLMEFDKDAETLLRAKWKDYHLQERLEIVGICAAMLLGAIGLIFAYLKIDTATKGFYTRRLQLVYAVATIIVIYIIIVNS